MTTNAVEPIRTRARAVRGLQRLSLIGACALSVLLASSPGDPGTVRPLQPVTEQGRALATQQAAAAAPTVDVLHGARVAARTRTRSGYFARVTYPKRAEPGARSTLTVRLGHLRGQSPRQVYRRYRLLESVKGSPWRLARRVAATGQRTVQFTVTAPAETGGWRLRLELLRPDGKPPIHTAPVRVDVRAPEVPDLGSPDDWSSISGTGPDGSVVRWDPCTPIRWTFNPNGADNTYPHALADLTTSLSRISAHTGLQFQYVGASPIVPYASATAISPSDDATADLFIGFASRRDVPQFEQGVIGLGGPLYYKPATDKTRWIDMAAVVFNTAFLDATDTTKSSARVVWRSLMAHEVLHAIGLGHATGAQQIMYPYIQEHETFGAGDITGMAVHGATHGCAVGFPDPTAELSALADTERLGGAVKHG